MIFDFIPEVIDNSGEIKYQQPGPAQVGAMSKAQK